jgi:hypothetical protein
MNCQQNAPVFTAANGAFYLESSLLLNQVCDHGWNGLGRATLVLFGIGFCGGNPTDAVRGLFFVVNCFVEVV